MGVDYRYFADLLLVCCRFLRYIVVLKLLIMKRFIYPLVAVIVATVFVFATPKHYSHYDRCADSSKHWFKIKGTCANQYPWDFLYLINTQNYSMITSQEVLDTCSGSQCVCAILACPQANGTWPDISSDTQIYAALYAWYSLGATNQAIAFKDDVISGDRRK